jgi:hypothetical protein
MRLLDRTGRREHGCDFTYVSRHIGITSQSVVAASSDGVVGRSDGKVKILRPTV